MDIMTLEGFPPSQAYFIIPIHQQYQHDVRANIWGGRKSNAI
jgi:hypothetical protein